MRYVCITNAERLGEQITKNKKKLIFFYFFIQFFHKNIYEDSGAIVFKFM